MRKCSKTVTDRDKGRSGSSCSPRARIFRQTSVENLPPGERAWIISHFGLGITPKVGDYPRSNSNGRYSTLDIVGKARSRLIYKYKWASIEALPGTFTPLHQSVPSGNVTTTCKSSAHYIQTQQTRRSEVHRYARHRVSRGFR